MKKIQAGYLTSIHFKDIYLYLSQNKLPTSKTAIRKVEMLAERYILLDSKPDFVGAWKCAQLISKSDYQYQFTLNYTRKGIGEKSRLSRNMA